MITGIIFALRRVILLLLLLYSVHLAFSQSDIQNYPIISNSDSLKSVPLNESAYHSTSSYLQPLPRFFYTNFVMLTSSIAGHLYLYMRTTDQDWASKISWKHIEQTFTLPPQMEEDHWTFNYLVHPYMGSLTYLASRNRGGKPAPSLFFSTINSAMYEYFVASSIQRPSLNDMIITPLAGMLLGEGLFAIKKQLLRDSYLNIYEKCLITIIDPYELLRNKFSFHRLIYQYKTKSI